eukprot:Em0212g1a
MPLHVMANFGGFLCECAWPGKYISLINLLKASLVYAADSAEVSYTVASHIVRGDRCVKDYGFQLSQRGSILLSVSIRTAPTSPITRGHTKLVLGNRCLKANYGV